MEFGRTRTGIPTLRRPSNTRTRVRAEHARCKWAWCLAQPAFEQSLWRSMFHSLRWMHHLLLCPGPTRLLKLSTHALPTDKRAAQFLELALYDILEAAQLLPSVPPSLPDKIDQLLVIIVRPVVLNHFRVRPSQEA
mmetsp:Transcript_449/g.856  ORF Transcript_449/g.856 Transcript_449/m.856 type:complete len:136 (+) Transcript_449:164-571(+)